MTLGQRVILAFLDKHFPDTAREPTAPDAVVADIDGSPHTLGVNLSGDIYDGDAVLARSNLDHVGETIITTPPTAWTIL